MNSTTAKLQICVCVHVCYGLPLCLCSAHLGPDCIHAQPVLDKQQGKKINDIVLDLYILHLLVAQVQV